MIKILEQIDIQPILDFYTSVENDITWGEDYVSKGKQTGIQYKENTDPWLSAVGRSKGDELSHDQLNPFYKGTIIESLINQFNLKRTRLLWLNSGRCYSVHTDATPRIHIPLITNPQCFFIFKKGIVRHLPAGSVYWTDTRFEHTAMNGSEFPRLHLVGAVES
jgi:hypothetical protein